MTYAKKLKDPRWQRKRLEILQRDDFTCRFCGDTETTLHVHHKEYSSSDPWDSPQEHLITCCEHCHTLISGDNASCTTLKIKKRIGNSGNVFLFALSRLEGTIGLVLYCLNETTKTISFDGLIMADEFHSITELIQYSENGKPIS